MKNNEYKLLKLYQQYSEFKEYWSDEDLVAWKLGLIPQDLKGKSVLDVGAFEGFYSFVCEMRGAKQIVAIDNSPDHKQFCYPQILKTFNSKVEGHFLNLHDLDYFKQKFDVVIVFDVISCVEDPLRALRVIQKKSQNNLYFCDLTNCQSCDKPSLELLDSDQDRVWLANSSCYAKMLERAEFYPVESTIYLKNTHIGMEAIVSQKITDIYSLDHRILHP